MVGWRYYDPSTREFTPIKTGSMEEFRGELNDISYDIEAVVAHNLKFDWKWFIRDYEEAQVEPYHEIAMHCTMTAEYLHTGQAEKFITLEDLAAKYGIKMSKTMDLGSYIASGGKMEDIPEEQLREYLETDIRLLSLIYLAQENKYQEFYDMDYIHALAEMEMNGLPIDRDACTKLAIHSQKVCDVFVDRCKNYIKHSCEWRDGDPITDADFIKKIKPTANRTLSFLLTGYPEQVRTTSDKWTFKWKDGGSTSVLTESEVRRVYGKDKPTNLGYSMDDTHIQKMISVAPGLHHLIPNWRANDKLLNTYYLPFLSKSKYTGCVHPKLNTTVTATGRLSSSDPNGQNMPTDARKLVTAPRGHVIMEVDFSQLELVALATICGDEQMLKDINDGQDIHFNSGQRVMGWIDPSDMTKDDRKLVKNVNFGAVYGGKAPGLSYQTGVDKDTVQKLINSLYKRYPGIGEWQKEFYTEVINNMEPNGHDDKGEQLYKSTVGCQGRTYTFNETPSPRWLRKRMGRSYSFNPNQVYNYPIQGYAGWMIVLSFLTKLWRKSDTDTKFIMTVHDSIVMIVPEAKVDYTKSTIQRAAEEVQEQLELPVPLSVDIEIGPTWS